MKKVMIFFFKTTITGRSSHQPAVVVHLTLPVALQAAVINLSLPPVTMPKTDSHFLLH
jgi:hypothetical protein